MIFKNDIKYHYIKKSLIYKENYSKDSNRIADLYTFLSQDAIDLKDYKQAEFYFSESIRIYSLNRGRDTSEVSKELSNFGAFLDSMARFDEAEKNSPSGD